MTHTTTSRPQQMSTTATVRTALYWAACVLAAWFCPALLAMEMMERE